ncbi:MAG TPA: acetate--CoA ligase [Verrucomicrobiales bacterium]|nr:acetate--CoA ligase [Verrucomicrobiales bacterium]HRJ09246.1 acetate--CoA ligase [Prosthecobacter sp.]HRK14781.1 acetate--CoA ligase [Prosthecobacter sp.]
MSQKAVSQKTAKAAKNVKSATTSTKSLLVENRVFKPAAEFSRKARISSMAHYRKMHEESLRHPEKFFAREAKELAWRKPFKKVLDWKCPNAKWFTGGQLNVSENCLDRHLDGPRKTKAAIIWEGEPGEKRVITYQQLHRDVCRFSNVLKRHKVRKGDRVVIYMPMVPEAAVAMLACTRIGAVHSVVFGGFSAESIKDRVLDSGATVVITSDGGYRRGAVVPLKKNVDDALKGGDTPVKTVIVLRRTGQDVHIEEGRDYWWHRELEYVDANCPAVALDSEAPLFILYTSGSTGKPKGILHSTAGYLLHAQMTCKYVFDLRDDDVYWCTADIGWVTGHSYMVYGPLAMGATSLMYEGAPNWPENDRFWRIIEEYAVTVFYTAPTAIRAFMKWGDDWLKKHDLSSLRLLGTVGEPINPEAWMWYHKLVGGGRCPIVDTWWQTETGGHMITPIPGATPTKPGTATLPFFGVDAAIVDDLGKEVGTNEQGKLVIRKPWPSMLRGIWGDKKRYQDTYWSEFKGWYFAGDGARRDKDGYIWIIGRIDDVLNVAGHRLGTAEVESALVSHPAVAESAVVGRPDELKGQGVVCFVTVKEGVKAGRELADALKSHVRKVIGPVATPDEIRFAAALPKTRSGKIMRRLLKQIAAGETLKGDTTTLEDINVIAALAAASGED